LLDELRDQALKIAAELPDQLQRVALRAGDVSVEVEWRAPAAPVPVPVATPVPAAPPAPAVAAQQPAAAPAAEPAGNRSMVTAPLVGAFYRAAEPGAAPFVEVGDTVEPGQTLAIIEAMKLLNEIKAEVRARVVAVHVENGEMVEYGQHLIELEPVD
jgi:acetyl-CoA carboxylase biotin carboxyl carrier protein